MTTGEKVLLVLSGVFAAMTLILLLYMPANRLFALPDALYLALCGLIALFFLLFVRFRQNVKLSLVFMWILCGIFILMVILFALASWSI